MMQETITAPIRDYMPAGGTEVLQRRVQVLIVEDDLTFKPLWESVFSQSCPNVKLDWATTQELAEILIRRRFRKNDPYDLIVSDIFLAGQGTGVDLWQRFGEAAKNFAFVSVLSKERFDAIVTKAQGYGYPVFLQKPLKAKDCKDLVKNLL